MARATHNLKPSASSFDTGDKPSMGDLEFVDGRVRVMFDEAKDILFTAPNPKAAVPGLVDKWATEFAPTNAEYEQTMSMGALNAFLQARGYGAGDTGELDPLRALLASTLERFATAAIDYHEERIDGPQLQFTIDTAAEDCVMALRGMDNPAD
jgi:hypothetical protein